MPVREVPDRRGRPVRGREGLLERDDLLHAISTAVDAVQAGTGAALLLEGHAGMGKTRLHEAALDDGRRLGNGRRLIGARRFIWRRFESCFES